jgi:hypothetical protein
MGRETSQYISAKLLTYCTTTFKQLLSSPNSQACTLRFPEQVQSKPQTTSLLAPSYSTRVCAPGAHCCICNQVYVTVRYQLGARRCNIASKVSAAAATSCADDQQCYPGSAAHLLAWLLPAATLAQNRRVHACPLSSLRCSYKPCDCSASHLLLNSLLPMLVAFCV